VVMTVMIAGTSADILATVIVTNIADPERP